jgi:S-adenosylmethionine/arginine decarboxylase-like enzyme
MNNKIKLYGFNNLTKTLSFNIYDICYAKTQQEQRDYIAYIDEQYNSERLKNILLKLTDMIGATVLNVSLQDYEPQGASVTVLISEEPKIPPVKAGKYANRFDFRSRFQNLICFQCIGSDRQMLPVLFKASDGHCTDPFGYFYGIIKFFFPQIRPQHRRSSSRLLSSLLYHANVPMPPFFILSKCAWPYRLKKAVLRNSSEYGIF